MESTAIRALWRTGCEVEAAAWRWILKPSHGIEPLVRPLDAPALRVVSRLLVRAALRSPRAGAAARDWLVGRLRRPAACCEAGSSQRRLVEGLLGDGPGGAGVDWLRRYLAAQPPARAARVCESLVRISLLGMVRHDLLARARAQLGQTAPVLVELQLGAYPHCSLRCRGCYGAGARAERAPTTPAIARVVDEAAGCGALAIHVVGPGEPLYSNARAHELVDLIAARPHLLFTIATSGVGLDASLAARFAKLGNVLFLVSVEGPREAHDARRGVGSCDLAWAALDHLRRHGLFYGFACMVGGHNHRAVLDPDWLASMQRAGCAMGIYSRFFPLDPSVAPDLRLDASSLASFRAGLARARSERTMPLLDLDEIEEHTGCRARAGASVYIDAMSGEVTPCIRMPFAPPGCRLESNPRRTLAEVLEGSFFAGYRTAPAGPVAYCGDDLAGELDRLATDLAVHGTGSLRLEQYRDRARAPRRARREVACSPHEAP